MSTANSFAKLINWNYTISGDFVDEFMPTAANNGSVTASAAGYTTVLAALNDFVGKAIDTMLSDTAKAAINWTKGDNTKLIPNLRKALQYVAAYNPEYLFGTGYETVYAGYYDTVVDKSASDQDVVTALGAIGVKALMPQIILPSAAELKGQNEIAGAMFKMREDPRVTKIGRFIRKHSIDEFPQFLNVFLGQMSVVGPRPPLPNEVAQYTEYDLQRLAVKPGITGWWQVTDRNSTGFDGMVQRDLEYIAKRGPVTDLKIVVLTVIEVITGKGAC